MARSRQELRSEETKQAILTAAQEQFAERGYDSVTMREIAKSAGCSHTTIYLYFKDKEDLLHQLSMGPLQSLQAHLESIVANQQLLPDERLKLVSREFIQFCLLNRNMYSLFFMAKSSRVDEEQPVLEVQQLRVSLFAVLKQVVRECLQHDLADEQILAYTRIYFFTLNGIIGTYLDSVETFETLMNRLAPTFELAIDVLLSGFRHTLRTGPNAVSCQDKASSEKLTN